ncbi:hypothetical protein B0H67DRAFT_134253 [Lasiosphaeris hirsuta]|uniref:Uncharacterized protein n=1 Tax=Lasiosphaeris hirsuta TaxID=260670 RepID=A0AA40B0U2_9PEZI|nr:hypothetical protein B0H67DRAFT_134253 [Lasiosphaeris hirsuta]
MSHGKKKKKNEAEKIAPKIRTNNPQRPVLWFAQYPTVTRPWNLLFGRRSYVTAGPVAAAKTKGGGRSPASPVARWDTEKLPTAEGSDTLTPKHRCKIPKGQNRPPLQTDPHDPDNRSRVLCDDAVQPLHFVSQFFPAQHAPSS